MAQGIEREQPVTTGNWILTIIITVIPILNIIMLLVWALGSSAPASKKNWAKAQIIIFLIGFVVTFLLYLAGVVQY